MNYFLILLYTLYFSYSSRMSRKMLSFLLMFTLFFTFVPTSKAANISFEEQVAHLEEQKVISSAKNFLATKDSTLNKAQALKLIMDSTSLFDKTQNYAVRYPDIQVKNAQWYTPYVLAAVKFGIINNASNLEETLNSPITEAEFLTMLYKTHVALNGKKMLMHEMPNTNETPAPMMEFNNIDSSEWYYYGAKWAAETFYFMGNTPWNSNRNTTFDGAHLLTKEESAQLVIDYRTSFGITDQDTFGMLDNSSEMSNSSDYLSNIVLSYSLSGVTLPTIPKTLPVLKEVPLLEGIIDGNINEALLPLGDAKKVFTEDTGISSMSLMRKDGQYNYNFNPTSVSVYKSEHVIPAGDAASKESMLRLSRAYLKNFGIALNHYSLGNITLEDRYPYEGISYKVLYSYLVKGLPLVDSFNNTLYTLSISVLSIPLEIAGADISFPNMTVEAPHTTLSKEKIEEKLLSGVHNHKYYYNGIQYLSNPTNKGAIHVIYTKVEKVYMEVYTATNGGCGGREIPNPADLPEINQTYYVPALRFTGHEEYDSDYNALACSNDYACDPNITTIIPLVE